MEVFKRNITLNDFKNFNPQLNPVCMDALSDEDKWGKIPKDLIITETSIKSLNKIPLCEHNGNWILRYYNIKQLYYFLKNYDNSKTFYRLIGTDEIGYKWVDYNKSVVTEYKFAYVPTYDGFKCNDIILVNPMQIEYDELFGNADITELRNLLNQYYNGTISETRLTTPFISLNLPLTTSITNIGSFSNDLKKWEAEHDYTVNDMVFYEGRYYVCKTTHKSDLIFNARYWDKLDNDVRKISSEHWGDVSKDELYVESCLHYFIPHRRSYDEQGNILPFITIKESVSTLSTALIYQKTYRNYQTLSSGLYVDELNNIYVSTDGETWEDLSEDLRVETNEGYFKCSGLAFAKYKFVKFIYTIGVLLNDNGIKMDNTGVRYEEIRRCEYVKNYVGDFGRVNYLNVYDNTVYSEEHGHSRPYAKITGLNPNNTYFTVTDMGKYNSSVHNFMDDAIVGSTFIDFDIPEVNVNRGNYAAMERHYILGEIKSFDDLQNYRNNLFKL
jgi:hypothetical protein